MQVSANVVVDAEFCCSLTSDINIRYDPLPDRYSEDLRNLVRAMINADPSKRPGIEQVTSNRTDTVIYAQADYLFLWMIGLQHCPTVLSAGSETLLIQRDIIKSTLGVKQKKKNYFCCCEQTKSTLSEHFASFRL